MTNGAKSFYALVVTVACHAILFDQFLVKGDVLLFLFDRQTFGGYFADLFYYVAGNTLRGWTANKRGMTGKTIRGKFSMGIDRLSGADH